jgi:hypothetical protein
MFVEHFIILVKMLYNGVTRVLAQCAIVKICDPAHDVIDLRFFVKSYTFVGDQFFSICQNSVANKISEVKMTFRVERVIHKQSVSLNLWTRLCMERFHGVSAWL